VQRLDAIGNSELRETLLFARKQALPVTADDVAAAGGIHRNVARARLERLAGAGLLVPSFERRTGRTGPGAGRPAKTYRVAPEISAIEFPERRYDDLIGLVVDALPERGRGARLHDIGVEFGRLLARQARLRPADSFRGALRGVCRALGSLGYQAVLGEATDRSGVIRTATCPLRPLMHARGELAQLDRGMWAGLVAEAFPAVESEHVSCDTCDCQNEEAACRVLLTVSPI
jgi:predicted ArsR family transcriptional regulator